MLAGVSATSFDFVRTYFSGYGKESFASGAQPDSSASQPKRVEAVGQEAFSEEDQRRLELLKKTDREVRQHEQMHLSAGGDLVTSGATYGYEKGPDGQRYAVSGEVGIDTSKADTPEKTVPKSRRIRTAALAPPDPSAQDRRVAAMASQMEMAALMEIAQQRFATQQEQDKRHSSGVDAAGGTGKAVADALGNGSASGMLAYRRMMEESEIDAMGMSTYA